VPEGAGLFRRLVYLQEEAEVAYTRFVSISVDPPEVEAAFRAGLGARWTFLSDAARQYLEPLDLLETTDTLHRPYAPPSSPCTKTSRSTPRTTGTGSGAGPTLEELRQDFRHITRTIRPDWDVPR
jgi:hypothetical protein